MERQGVRAEWNAIPRPIRDGIDAVAGSPVRAATNLTGGFSPGPAARCDLVDGRRVFVKAAGTELNPDSPAMHRREAEILSSLDPRIPAPTLLGVVDDGDWVAIVVAWVDGRMPTAPLGRADVERILALIERLGREPVRTTDIQPFAAQHAGLAGHWRPIAADPALLARIDPWSRRNIDRLVDLDDRVIEAASGDAIAHLDLRSDNVLLGNDGPDHDVVVDWPSAAQAAPWLDLVTALPALHLDGGPTPAEIFGDHPLGRASDRDAVDAFLAGVTGYFARMSLLPTPPGLPTLRPFQAAQARVATAWLADRLAN